LKGLKLLLVLSSFALVSCEPDENLSPDPITSAITSFDGVWSLDNITCECAPTILNMGDDVWTFDSETNTLSIENNVSSIYPNLDSTGVRNITYTEDSVFFDGFGYHYYIEDECLLLADSPELDGPLMKFIPFESLPTTDCNNLYDGLIQRNDSLLALEINTQCTDLTPLFYGELGHQVNLNSLVNRLNNNCSNICVSVVCYACIETWPPMSELDFQMDSAGTTVHRMVDILMPDDNVLSYVSID